MLATAWQTNQLRPEVLAVLPGVLQVRTPAPWLAIPAGFHTVQSLASDAVSLTHHTRVQVYQRCVNPIRRVCAPMPIVVERAQQQLLQQQQQHAAELAMARQALPRTTSERAAPSTDVTMAGAVAVSTLLPLCL
jgi:hypothetical protein